VSEEVYAAYKRPAWRERKQEKARRGKEVSWDALREKRRDVPARQLPVEELVEIREKRDRLSAALAKLDDGERRLIQALFFEERSEREVAREIKLSQKAINKRIHVVLKKLAALIKNNF
jgi:RNA polymerase sigma factor (sigma-70 family)